MKGEWEASPRTRARDGAGRPPETGDAGSLREMRTMRGGRAPRSASAADEAAEGEGGTSWSHGCRHIAADGGAPPRREAARGPLGGRALS